MSSRTEPCRTPEDTAILSEFVPFSKTDCILLSRKYLIQFRMFPLYRKSEVLIIIFREQLCQSLTKIKEDKDVCLFSRLHTFGKL